MDIGMSMGRMADTTPRLSAQAQTMIARDKAEKSGHAAANKAAQEFEGVFLTNMLEGMFSGEGAEAPFGGGAGESTYRSMLTAEYAKEISRGGGIGIADHVAREMIAIQESSK